MSIFATRHRLEHAQQQDGGNGGNGGQQQQQQQQPAEWLKPFGEHAKAFEGVKDPAELATRWTAANTELTTLKANSDWRKQLAGDDAEAQKALARFTDPKAFYKSFNDAQTKIRSGELAKPLGKDATAEQVKEWRAANGIPETPADYFKALPDGLVIGKEDQPVFDIYGKIAHEHNAPPALMHAFTKAYYEGQQQVAAEEAKVDRADSQKAIAELRTKWGNDYGPNMSILNNFLEGMPADVRPLFQDATLADGTRIMNNPAVVEFFAKAARELNPMAHLLPAGGEGDMKSLDSEIAGIEKVMRENRQAYNKDEKMQARFRDLIAARQKMQAKK